MGMCTVCQRTKIQSNFMYKQNKKQRVATNQMIKCPPINFNMKWKAMMAHDTLASTNTQTHTRLLSVFIGNKK